MIELLRDDKESGYPYVCIENEGKCPWWDNFEKKNRCSGKTPDFGLCPHINKRPRVMRWKDIQIKKGLFE